MSTPPQDGSAAPQYQPYGQPFDPTVFSPEQQPPPPGWEQGTWTQHGDPGSPTGNGRMLLLGGGVLVVVLIAAAVLFLFV